jgi:hypothetical protein
MRKLDRLEEYRQEFNGEFPLGIFPTAVRKIIAVLESELGFPIPFISCALLHAAATAIGNAAMLSFKWVEAANLYMMFVAAPSTSKSHPVQWAYRPLAERDKRNYQLARKSAGEYIFHKTLLTDATIEATLKALATNPRSICILSDEVAGFLNSMSRFFQHWLSLWNRISITVDRKTTGITMITHPFVSLIGTLQTGILANVFRRGQKDENGMLDRFLVVFPQNLSRKGWSRTHTRNIQIESEWDQIIEKLLSLPTSMDADGNLVTNFMTLSEEAADILITYQNKPPKPFPGVVEFIHDRIAGKLDQYLLRLCIPIQLLRWACEDANKNIVDAETARYATTLVSYFRNEAMLAWEHINVKNPLDGLSEKQLNIYTRLSNEFQTKKGISIAESQGMGERTFKYWLKTGVGLFKRLGFGLWEKKYKG